MKETENNMSTTTTKNRVSQTTRVANLFTKGMKLSAVQIANRLGTSPNRARFIISGLRDAGYVIAKETKVSRDGTRVNKYSFASY